MTQQEGAAAPPRHRYSPPPSPREIEVRQLLEFCDRPVDDFRTDLFRKDGEAEPVVWWAGDLGLLKHRCVSVIGARNVSERGRSRARRVAKELAAAGVVVVSGLAKGVDVTAHAATITAGGSTVAVIGTPLNRAYPAEHGELQEEIWQDHLLLSQFRPGQRTFPSDFPKRNRLMAAVTDASIIVEASDTSGTLHQAAECVRLGRWLFIMSSVVEDPSLSWPKKFLKEQRVVVMQSTEDLLNRIGS